MLFDAAHPQETEIVLCAIEMAGYLDLHVDLIKGGVEKYGLINPS